MKAKVTVALVQFEPRWLETEHNAERMKTLAEEQARAGAELIVFPELANVGYITPQKIGDPPSYGSDTSALEFAVKYHQASEYIPGLTTGLLGQVAESYGVHIVVGLSQKHPAVPGSLYNSAVLIGPSGTIGVHHKMHIPSNEKYYFYRGETADVYETELGNIAMMICYDLRFPELARIYALKGAEIICVPWGGSWKGKFTDPEHLRHRAFTRAQENACFVLLCNRTGKEGTSQFIGRSLVTAPHGQIIASTESQEETVVTAELSYEDIIQARSLHTVFQDRRPDMYSRLVEPTGIAPAHKGNFNAPVDQELPDKATADSGKPSRTSSH